MSAELARPGAMLNQAIGAVGRPIHGPTPPGGAVPCARTSPLSEAELREVVDLIADGRIGRHAVELPAHLQTRDWSSVIAVMLGLDARLGWPTAGWKIGAASEEIRAIEGMPTPSPGRLYKSRVFTSPATLAANLFINYREVECEFAFKLAEDLPERVHPYCEAEVARAVESAFPVLEIGDMVFLDWYGASGYFGPSLDNGGGGVLVCGSPIDDWQAKGLDTAFIELSLNGQIVKTGVGSAAMGNPLTSLTWMANWASDHRIPLKAGEVVSTGTCTGHCFVASGDLVTADFGVFGTVTATMESANDPNPEGAAHG